VYFIFHIFFDEVNSDLCYFSIPDCVYKVTGYGLDGQGSILDTNTDFLLSVTLLRPEPPSLLSNG